MKLTGKLKEPQKLQAAFAALKISLSGGYEQGFIDGMEAGRKEAEEEIFFTRSGAMYKPNMVISVASANGFINGLYRWADKLETVEVPNMKAEWTPYGSVFRECGALKTAALPKIKLIGPSYFQDDTALEEITLGCEEVPMVEIGAKVFDGCAALVRLNLVGAIITSFSLSSSPLLDDVSIQNVVDSLADMTGETSQTLTLHPDVGARLTEEQKAAIAAKNWSVVY